jgi:hypothetical protein
VTYLWKQTTGFLDNSIEIVNSTDAVAQFKVPEDLIKDTTFTFKLTVKDSYAETSTDTISIDAISNSKPVVDVGGDIKAERGEEVTLDGTGSYDPDPTGEIVSYNSTQTGGSSPSVNLNSANVAIPSFTVPNLVEEDTTFEFTLTLIDDEGAEDKDTVGVEVKVPSSLSPPSLVPEQQPHLPSAAEHEEEEENDNDDREIEVIQVIDEYNHDHEN